MDLGEEVDVLGEVDVDLEEVVLGVERFRKGGHFWSSRVGFRSGCRFRRSRGGFRKRGRFGRSRG